VLALLVVGPLVGESPGRLLADALLVALCANLANLADVAPGRTVKLSVAAFAVLVLAARRTSDLSACAVVVGAALGLFLDDLHERLMLGDAGANVLGAVLGLGVVAACGPTGRDVVLVAVAGLNLAGELVSFSRVIDAVPPLRAVDRAGRRP
jgi:UDP-N-acetylmuramyl pentapeptide phosphotransferase/UDP-N-acetylglucosamine-1-phosphate transferase